MNVYICLAAPWARFFMCRCHLRFSMGACRDGNSPRKLFEIVWQSRSVYNSNVCMAHPGGCGVGANLQISKLVGFELSSMWTYIWCMLSTYDALCKGFLMFHEKRVLSCRCGTWGDLNTELISVHEKQYLAISNKLKNQKTDQHENVN